MTAVMTSMISETLDLSLLGSKPINPKDIVTELSALFSKYGDIRILSIAGAGSRDQNEAVSTG